jgi:4-nitrophenyl phosphatase
MPASLRSALASAQGVILDMDGVLWQGNTPLPGLTEFFGFLRRRAIRLLLATNNASLTPRNYQLKLERMGVTVAAEEILTSALATADYLRTVARPGDRAYIIGEEGLLRAVESAGLTVAGPDEVDARFVVVGMDRAISWDKLAAATINLNRGARFIGTNSDVTFPPERGISHGNGAILAALSAASGLRPKVIGKPFPALMRTAVKRLGLPKARIVTVGDRLETDILGARNAGLRSILVLTGVTRRRDLKNSRIRPTWVVKDLPALLAAWTGGPKRRGG